jgi:glutathione S-transferase
MITVHHLENSRSQRVLWLLEELGLPYEVVRYERNPKTKLAPPELRALHPLGKSPIIQDGGQTVAETGAIIEYLLGKYGEGRLVPPASAPERLRYTYWLHYAEGSAMSPLLLKLLFGQMMPAGAPPLLKPLVRSVTKPVLERFIDPQLKLHADFWEGELSKTAWFAGAEFTAADIQMSFPLEAAASRGDTGVKRPHTEAFLQTIHARPAYRRALERGGPYAYAS